MEIDPPHGSVMGSNGYVLSKPQQDTAATQHRTNWSPSGTTTAGHAAKTLPSAALRACTLGTQKTDISAFPALGEGKIEAETKNGTSLNPPPPPVVVHRARKTMSRPASNQTLKVKYQPVDPQFQGITYWLQVFSHTESFRVLVIKNVYILHILIQSKVSYKSECTHPILADIRLYLFMVQDYWNETLIQLAVVSIQLV